jgi:hypothetical protein
MHKMHDYESSDGMTRYKNGHKAPKATKQSGVVFDPKPGTTKTNQAASLVRAVRARDSFTAMHEGMPQQFNRINEMPLVNDENESLTEQLLMSRWS